MKKTLLGCLLIWCGLAVAEAREFNWLQDIHRELDRAYQASPGDNNYIEYLYKRSIDLDVLERDWRITIDRRELALHEMFGDIKRCLFMQEGAYGRHISNREANSLTRLFIEKVTNSWWIVEPNIYIVENVQLDIVNNNCAVLVVGPINRESILMQGVSFD